MSIRNYHLLSNDDIGLMLQALFDLGYSECDQTLTPKEEAKRKKLEEGHYHELKEAKESEMVSVQDRKRKLPVEEFDTEKEVKANADKRAKRKLTKESTFSTPTSSVMEKVLNAMEIKSSSDVKD